MPFYSTITATSYTGWEWDTSATTYTTVDTNTTAGTWTFVQGEPPRFEPATVRYNFVDVTSYGSPYTEYIGYPVADMYPQRYAAQDRVTEDAFVAEMRVPESPPRVRARELLIDSLTEEQRKQFETNNEFEVVGSRGNRYIIEGHSVVQNVRARSGPRGGRRLCAHPSGVPLEDGLLTQKLLLETDEDAFLAVANG